MLVQYHSLHLLGPIFIVLSRYSLFTSYISFISLINEFSNPIKLLNEMKDIRITKLDNFVINSITNPILLIKLPMIKVFFFSPINQAITLFQCP